MSEPKVDGAIVVAVDDSPENVAAVRWAAVEDLRDELFPPADVAVLAKVRARLGAR